MNKRLAVELYKSGLFFLRFDDDTNKEMAFKRFLQAAEEGYVKAQTQLGIMHSCNGGFILDYEKADYWFYRAAEGDDADAKLYLVLINKVGVGIIPTPNQPLTRPLLPPPMSKEQVFGDMCYMNHDYAKALEWYLRATELMSDLDFCESDQICYRIGKIYEQGLEVPHDIKQAMDWYKKAAEQSYAYAQCKLGDIYYDGTYVEQDLDTAYNWYYKAAVQELYEAQYKLGVICEQDESIQKQIKAAEWYIAAAEQVLTNAKEAYERVLNKLHQQVENMDLNSQFDLGLIYYNGLEKDYDRSAKLIINAAEAGHYRAMRYAGNLYLSGKGVKKDAQKALEMYKNAAELGCLYSQISLVMIYELGMEDIPQNLSESAKWLHKLAEQGHEIAIYTLARKYEEGDGFSKDFSTAIDWYRKLYEDVTWREEALKRVKALKSDTPQGKLEKWMTNLMAIIYGGKKH